MKKELIIESHGAAETRRIGRLLGHLLKAGAVVALSGELGSGKTQFIKGLANGLGVDRRYQVASPSFVLINEYPGKIPLYHLDLYRLSRGEELEELGLEEYFYGSGVAAIEWAEKATLYVPSESIWIDIRWKGTNRRQLFIRAKGKTNVPIIEGISKAIERDSLGKH